ncbi:MAG: DUF1488 family protein [Deltaproteobacteria bacterium]|nr:DUF1488 family protein [Deltaproteobacteria bacterium]
MTQRELALLAGVSTPTISRFENGEDDLQLSSVNKILKVFGMIDRRILTFPDSTIGGAARAIWEHDTVEFWGFDGDNRIRCCISEETLKDRFPNDGWTFITIFQRNRPVIEQMARRKYLAGKIDEDGSITIQSVDW